MIYFLISFNLSLTGIKCCALTHTSSLCALLNETKREFCRIEWAAGILYEKRLYINCNALDYFKNHIEMIDTIEKDDNIISEEEAAQYDRQIRLWGLDAQKRFELC